MTSLFAAGWSSSVARRAHNPKVVGSNPTPATIEGPGRSHDLPGPLLFSGRRVKPPVWRELLLRCFGDATLAGRGAVRSIRHLRRMPTPFRHEPPRSAPPTTRSSHTGTATNAPLGSTTEPTRSTRPASASGSCAAITLWSRNPNRAMCPLGMWDRVRVSENRYSGIGIDVNVVRASVCATGLVGDPLHACLRN